MLNSQNSTPLSPDPQFPYLVAAFLDELDNNERDDLRHACDKFAEACYPDVPEAEARAFFWNACPGFHAYEQFWLTLPCWQRFSNRGPVGTFRSSWERRAYGVCAKAVSRD